MTAKIEQDVTINPVSPEFDVTVLVTKKPSSVPAIYQFIIEQSPITPKSVREELGVSKSVTFSALDKLQRLGLVEQIGYGEYQLADIALHSETVWRLGELRSKRQFDFCRFAAQAGRFDVADLRIEFGGHRSTLRRIAVQLRDKQFLEQEEESFEKSPRAYRLTKAAEHALGRINVEYHLGRDGRYVSPHTTGIGDTEFRTSYEIEDAHHIARSNREWVEPEELAQQLDKNHKKTLSRLAAMEDRGLLESKPLREKMVFEANLKTQSLIHDLHLFAFSKEHQLDLYGVAKQSDAEAGLTLDKVYSTLQKAGYQTTPKRLAAVLNELKRAELIEGNSRTGYRFAQL